MTKLEQLNEKNAARKRWKESERILRILRTEAGKPIKEATEEAILIWYQKNVNQT